MVRLPDQFDEELSFVRVVRKKECLLWNIFIGNWDKYPRSAAALQYQTKEEILMNPNNLLQFAIEIRRLLKKRPSEEEQLRLQFQENIPQFRVHMRFMIDKSQLFFLPELKGYFEFHPCINIHSSQIDERSRYEYLYENGGSFIGRLLYYPPSVLEQFASDLEREAAPYLKKYWWKFW